MWREFLLFLPKSLAMEQKQFHLDMSYDKLNFTNNNPDFLELDTVATGDGSWVQRYDPEPEA